MQRRTRLLVLGKIIARGTAFPVRWLRLESLSTLTGVPIAGEILTRCNGHYWGLILFTICCYVAGLICAVAVKIIHCGWNNPWAIY